MIKNIIFDMGKVLIDFQPKLFVERLHLNEEDTELLLKVVFDSPAWVMLDWGYMTDAEAAAYMQERLPERLHTYVPELIADWSDPIIPIEGMEALIAQLKEKGYGIYLLSNAGPNHDRYWERIPGSTYFDGKIVSAFEKVCKPEKKIYERLLSTFGLMAEECLFVDDLPANILSAQLLGFDGIVFKNAEQLRVELENRKIL